MAEFGVRAIQIAALAMIPLLAGCFGSNGGSGNLTGTATIHNSLELVSATVTDGTLREVTVHNKATHAIPTGTWTLHMTGTSGGKTTTHDSMTTAAQFGSGETRAISVADSKQPDWQDGTDLTILAKAPDGTQADLTIRTV